MLSDLLDLARSGGAIARDHFLSLKGSDVVVKAPRDYVSHVDRLIEDTLVTRIRARFPDHQVMGEEGAERDAGRALDPWKPLWIIDPIDGTTNFIRGIPAFCISIAYCEPDRQGGWEPRHGIIYDPTRDESFVGEAGSGLWLNGQRMWTSGCSELSKALLASALPFRSPAAVDDIARIWVAVQHACDDHRRGGSAALDLAYAAVGRLDGYYELGIHAWDTAAGELLVRCGGGVATDWRGNASGVTTRRSLVAGATPALHAELLRMVQPGLPWLEREPFTIVP